TPYFSNPNLTGLMRVHLTTTSYQNQAGYHKADFSFTAATRRNVYRLTEKKAQLGAAANEWVFAASNRVRPSEPRDLGQGALRSDVRGVLSGPERAQLQRDRGDRAPSGAAPRRSATRHQPYDLNVDPAMPRSKRGSPS